LPQLFHETKTVHTLIRNHTHCHTVMPPPKTILKVFSVNYYDDYNTFTSITKAPLVCR